MTTAQKTDLNDLLKRWQNAGIDFEQQKALAQGIFMTAQPVIERLADDAGRLAPDDKDGGWSPEYEDAIDAVVEMASKLDEKTLGKWRPKLARKCGLSLRDFNNALSGQKRSDKANGKSEDQPVYTFGGEQIGDYLIEYCFDPDEKRSALAVRKLPDGKAEMKDEIVIDGIKYKPMPAINDRIVMSQTVVFPSKLAAEKKTTRELAAIVEAFLRKNYLFDDQKIPRVISYYVMLTWLYDNFRTISYLRAKGDAGSGKSELMKRVGICCYRLTKNNGAGTMASFFRMTETYRGTVYFDEMDLDNSGADNEIVKFINLGAMDGNPVIRLDEVMRPDGGKSYQPVPYRSFCPKLFAMREDFGDNAVGSRSISFRLMGKEAEELLAYGVPFEITDAMDKHARNIRNLLLTWRMYEWKPGKRELGNELVDPMVSSRMNQVTMPIKSLAVDADGNIDQEFLNQITQLLRELHAEQVQERSITVEARVVEAIWKIYIYPDLRAKALHIQDDGSIRIKIGDVTVVANDIMNEMNSDRGLESQTTTEEEQKEKKKKQRDIEPRRVGRIIREVLNLKMLDRTNKGFFFVWDDLRMTVMGRKYGVLPDAEMLAKAQQAMSEALYAKNPPVVESQDELQW
jgi:hypothetical protein